MGALNINTYYGCDNCAYSDMYGNGCVHGLMFPVLLIMSQKTQCPMFRVKKYIEDKL